MLTGDRYSLVERETRPIANNLAFIEYDLVIANVDHGPELVIEELLTVVFDVFRESDPIADSDADILSLEHTEFSCLVERQLLLGAVLSDDDCSLNCQKGHEVLRSTPKSGQKGQIGQKEVEKQQQT